MDHADAFRAALLGGRDRLEIGGEDINDIDPTGAFRAAFGGLGHDGLDDIGGGEDTFDSRAFFSAIGGAGKRFPMPKFLTAPEVRSLSNERSTAIFETWKTLREVLRRHEATIQRRWSKKSKAQRLNVLLKAWPNMPLTHRPDFDAFRRESEPQRNAGTKFKQDYLWPYINQEDLTKPRSPAAAAQRSRPPSAFRVRWCRCRCHWVRLCNQDGRTNLSQLLYNDPERRHRIQLPGLRKAPLLGRPR
jgi:hypothetical protein